VIINDGLYILSFLQNKTFDYTTSFTDKTVVSSAAVLINWFLNLEINWFRSSNVTI